MNRAQLAEQEAALEAAEQEQQEVQARMQAAEQRFAKARARLQADEESLARDRTEQVWSMVSDLKASKARLIRTQKCSAMDSELLQMQSVPCGTSAACQRQGPQTSAAEVPLLGTFYVAPVCGSRLSAGAYAALEK